MPADSALSDPRGVAALARRLDRLALELPRPITLMEVCGTHTQAIAAAGLRDLIPENVRLVSGPGCPVCVTPVEYLDRAELLAADPAVTVCTFGDLLRVPSSRGSLERCAASGGNMRVVYSAHEALDLARARPDRQIVFLAIGFETTAPTVAAVLAEAEALQVGNLRVLSGHKLVAPALRALAGDTGMRIDGFLLPGHVAVVTGWQAYEFLARDLRCTAAVAGFTPVEILHAVIEIVRHISARRCAVLNLYPRVVTREGNPAAREYIERYFEPTAALWRGLGRIPESGLRLRARWAARDAWSGAPSEPPPGPAETAARAPDASLPESGAPLDEARGCRCGDVLRGRIDPPQCPLFGQACAPEHPIGACMVSGEGSCAAWFRYRRRGAGAGKEGARDT